MKLVAALALVCLTGCAGCKDCNKAHNPVSPDHPCGTRAHACSTNPLMCCWNSEVCGGPVGTGCPAGMCCALGDDYSVSPNPSAKPGANMSAQWSIGYR